MPLLCNKKRHDCMRKKHIFSWENPIFQHENPTHRQLGDIHHNFGKGKPKFGLKCYDLFLASMKQHAIILLYRCIYQNLKIFLNESMYHACICSDNVCISYISSSLHSQLRDIYIRNVKIKTPCSMKDKTGLYMGVSKNWGTPKWMVYNGKPY